MLTVLVVIVGILAHPILVPMCAEIQGVVLVAQIISITKQAVLYQDNRSQAKTLNHPHLLSQKNL